MKLLKLTVEGIRGLSDGGYSFEASDDVARDLTLIAGEPCCGKTTLLRTIIAAKESVGAWSPTGIFRELRRAGVERANIRAKWMLTAGEASIANASSRVVETVTQITESDAVALDIPNGLQRLFQEQGDAGIGRFGYFHSERALLNLRGRSFEAFTSLEPDNRRFGGLISEAARILSEDQERLAGALPEIGLQLPGARSKLTDLREALRPLVPRVALTAFRRADGVSDLIFQTASGAAVSSAALSTSERQGLLLALDAAVSDRSFGVILLDGPELHQHPAEHRRFLNAYSSLVCGAQIIASTSSDKLVETASAESVIQLKRSIEP